MEVHIGGCRVSFSDRYLQEAERDRFIEEQTPLLGRIAPQERVIQILGTVYDAVHPPKAEGTEIEGE